MREFVLGTIIGLLISIAITYYATPKEPTTLEVLDNVLNVVDNMDRRTQSDIRYEYDELCHYYIQYNGVEYENKKECYTLEELIALGEYYLGGN